MTSFEQPEYRDGFATVLTSADSLVRGGALGAVETTSLSVMSSHLIAGVDEAGRGPLLGPVAVAAVILNPHHPIAGLSDSKKLSEKRRNLLFDDITAHALSYAVLFVSPDKIDEINILQATLQGMVRCIDALPVQPSHVLVDGNQTLATSVSHDAVVGGDALHPQISAASILAKVARDRYMYHLHARYPEFGIDKHKGYPTKLHQQMLAQQGVLPEHRRSFRPVAAAIESASE